MIVTHLLLGVLIFYLSKIFSGVPVRFLCTRSKILEGVTGETLLRLSPIVVLCILLFFVSIIYRFSTRFSVLYLISLQQRSLNLVLYTLNPILETYFVPNFCTYVFIIPQMLWTYFIFI
jgi:hypothetical protein